MNPPVHAMDAQQIVASISWMAVLPILIAAYALSVGLFLILENRSPQSTFAWLFLLLVLLYEGAYFHAKTVCVDSILCSIGSANEEGKRWSVR